MKLEIRDKELCYVIHLVSIRDLQNSEAWFNYAKICGTTFHGLRWRNLPVTSRHTCWVAALYEGNDLASPSRCLPRAAVLFWWHHRSKFPSTEVVDLAAELRSAQTDLHSDAWDAGSSIPGLAQCRIATWAEGFAVVTLRRMWMQMKLEVVPPGKYLKIGHGRFLLHVSQFSIYYDRTIRYCITCAVDKALLNNKQKSIVRCLQSVTPSAAVHLAPHKRDALWGHKLPYTSIFLHMKDKHES